MAIKEFQVGKVYKHDSLDNLNCLVCCQVGSRFIIVVRSKSGDTVHFLPDLEKKTWEENENSVWTEMEEREAKLKFNDLHPFIHYPPGFEVGCGYVHKESGKEMFIFDTLYHPLYGHCFAASDFDGTSLWCTGMDKYASQDWEKVSEERCDEFFNPPRTL